MSRRLLTSLVPTVFGALILGAGCTFEPPGDVTGNTPGGNNNPGGADGGIDDPDDPDDPPAGAETLSVTFTTTPTPGGGEWGNANIVATWIEDAGGTFVETIDRHAGVRVQHLVAWNGKAGADQDAVSGATRLSHGTPVSFTWDIPADLANGIYTIRMELADINAVTPDQNNQGSFTFDKNGTASVQNVAGEGFLDVAIDYSGAAL